MANAVYPRYKHALLTGAGSPAPNTSLNQNTAADGPYVALIDTGTYTFSAGHLAWSSLSGIVGVDQRIANPVVDVNTAVFDGDDLTFTAVSGNSVEALVMYRRNVSASSTWRLVFFEDTGVSGLPVTPNGGNITVTWAIQGIFLISDKRLKDNIREVGDLLGILPVYSYNYVGQVERKIGLMAQDVEKVCPDAVGQFGKYKAVNYDRAIAAAFRLAA